MSYSRIADHHSMVFDDIRNSAYARALEKLIVPGTTIMDLGAGLGVHGLMAASMGAAQVHLVEPSPLLHAARSLAQENGLQNIHFHQCRVEELQLDMPVDVIVSVFTGNFLLSEDLLPSLFYARDKFLAPGGKLVPDRARMEIVPVTASAYYAKHVDAWNNYTGRATVYGLPELDYRAVRPFAANTLYYDTRDNLQVTPLAATTPLMELDFTLANRADCDSQVEVRLTQDGICHGWMGWFQMRLWDEWLSTSGDPVATHWSPVFLPLEQPLQVREGEFLRFALNRPEFGEWTWTSDYRNNCQRQSTFLSQPLTPERVHKSSDSFRPRLGSRGEAAQWLLAQMTGEVPVGELTLQLLEQFPDIFTSHSGALKFVKDFAERYG